jgi:hypothetical protein
MVKIRAETKTVNHSLRNVSEIEKPPENQIVELI